MKLSCRSVVVVMSPVSAPGSGKLPTTSPATVGTEIMNAGVPPTISRMPAMKTNLTKTSGRGGIYVFSPQGQHIGFAPIAGRVSNCAFGPGRYLYVTNDTQIVRGRIRADFPGGTAIDVSAQA